MSLQIIFRHSISSVFRVVVSPPSTSSPLNFSRSYISFIPKLNSIPSNNTLHYNAVVVVDNNSSRSSATIRRSFFTSAVHHDIIGHSLIPVINRLQEVCAITGSPIDLPQIIVIGGQSSGKSSVLENLVGRDFLPRGTGIVTRRPLVLQLHPLPTGSLEYGIFLHKPSEKFEDFNRIKDEISSDTEKVAGKNKGISSKPIVLKIFSPKVVPLTLVDTPGIARVPIGDQPQNIEQQIRALIYQFILKPSAIILAVQAANQDIATSDALQLSKEVDPEGIRTIGVLTKLDLMDKGTDAIAILTGRQFLLRRGWTAVINRSQIQIDQNVPIKESHLYEQHFFENHPVYKSIAERCGVRVLAQRCSKMLEDHIRKTMPNLKQQISDLIKKREQELESYGIPVSQDENDQGWLLLEILNKVTKQYAQTIVGDPSTSLDDLSSDSKDKLSPPPTLLGSGARIRLIFHDRFSKKLKQINPFDTNKGGLSIQDIAVVIKNASGSKPTLFVPDRAFEILAKCQINLLREPCLQVAESIYNEFLNIITKTETPELMRFWKLRDAILEVSTELLSTKLQKTQSLINIAIDAELSYINTNHPDFIGLDFKFQDVIDGDLYTSTEEKRGGAYQLTEKERKQIVILMKLLKSYFDIVKKSMHDQVIKIVMYGLVKSFINDVPKSLSSQLYKGERYKDLLYEATDFTSKRRSCRDEIDRLRKVKKEMQYIDEM